MDTAGLRLFVLAAERLNISAAGRELGIAPAVASARLAKLERQVGADLLRRSTRKVALSVAGAEFLPYAREILEREDAARSALGHGSAEVSGTLRFTAPSSFAQLYILPILPEFWRLHPDLHLDVRLSDAQYDLIEGSFDLALRNSAVEDVGLKGRRLADDTRILCASPAYLAAHGVPVSPDELGSHRLIAFRDSRPRPLAGPGGTMATFDPAAAGSQLTVDDGMSQKAVTLAGGGISANSLWIVHEELRSGALVQVLPDYTVADRSVLWLYYPQSNVLSPKVRVFIDFMVERIGRRPPWLHRRPMSAPPESPQ